MSEATEFAERVGAGLWKRKGLSIIPRFLCSMKLLIEIQKTRLDRRGEEKDHAFLKQLMRHLSRDVK